MLMIKMLIIEIIRWWWWILHYFIYFSSWFFTFYFNLWIISDDLSSYERCSFLLKLRFWASKLFFDKGSSLEMCPDWYLIAALLTNNYTFVNCLFRCSGGSCITIITSVSDLDPFHFGQSDPDPLQWNGTRSGSG